MSWFTAVNATYSDTLPLAEMSATMSPATENTNDLSPIHTADNRRVASCDRKKTNFRPLSVPFGGTPGGDFHHFPLNFSVVILWSLTCISYFVQIRSGLGSDN